jgi:hypothetical protein
MTDIHPILHRLAATFLPPAEQTGAAESDLLHAEQRLGVPLPAPLRAFYAVVANSPTLLNTHHHFRPPADLELIDRHLVFCDENQGAYFWGVPLDADWPEPQVDVRHRLEPEWHLDSSSLAQLLTHFACFQIVNALPASARFSYPRKVKEFLPSTFTDLLPRGIAYHMRSYVDFDRRMILSAFPAFPGPSEAYIAAPCDEHLEAFESQTGVELDWL